MKNVVAVVVLGVAGGGCSPGDARAGADGEVGSEVVAGHAEWVGTASGGTEVTLNPDPYPVVVGETSFHITLGRPVPEGTPVSIDIVSPEMPAMGIVRYPAEALGDFTYLARAEIAMGGAWEVYVNLGDGTDAASFEFDVESGENGHDHGSNGHQE